VDARGRRRGTAGTPAAQNRVGSGATRRVNRRWRF
jgi:hypothetical protein